ncbi:MAG: hypothetical protein PHQ75_11170 [Thermoguttaceae bacterium]|nr:hypothetical protein [Thermoguttaceae bacterium]
MNSKRIRQSFSLTLLNTLLILVLLVVAFRTGQPRSNRDPLTLPGLWATTAASGGGSYIATGSFDNTSDLFFYLDSQSGRLSAALLSRSTPSFVKSYTRNIRADLIQATQQLKLPLPANPQFIMATGDGDIRQYGAGEMNKISKSLAYVTEVNSGLVLVYAIPNEGDRDLQINGGEIIFWTYARLNTGTGEASVPVKVQAPGPAQRPVTPKQPAQPSGRKGSTPEQIKSTGFHW